MNNFSPKPTFESRSETTEDQELSAALNYLEDLPAELFTSQSSLLESVRQLFRTPSQRFRKDMESVIQKNPEWMLHTHHLSSIANKQTLSYLKAYFESDRESLQHAHKFFMQGFTGIAVAGSIYIVATEIYPAIASPGVHPFLDPTFLASSQAVTAIGLLILLGIALLKVVVTQRKLTSLNRLTLLLGLAVLENKSQTEIS